MAVGKPPIYFCYVLKLFMFSRETETFFKKFLGAMRKIVPLNVLFRISQYLKNFHINQLKFVIL